MLAYILGITKRGNKRYRFWGLQIGARGISNKGNLKDFKLEQKDYKSGQRDIKSEQQLKIGA